jgi:hypothetical protein
MASSFSQAPSNTGKVGVGAKAIESCGEGVTNFAVAEGLGCGCGLAVTLLLGELEQPAAQNRPVIKKAIKPVFLIFKRILKILKVLATFPDYNSKIAHPECSIIPSGGEKYFLTHDAKLCHN